MMNLVSGRFFGLRAMIAAATTLPVATYSTWPERNAAIVALLSSKRLMVVPGGAIFVISRSSSAPRVTPIALPARS
jgi:hypothetical protein